MRFGEMPGWIQQMMGHETLQMIRDRCYSHIKNYRRADGRAFQEKVFDPVFERSEESPELPDEMKNVTQRKKGELALSPNSPKIRCRTV